MTLALVQAEEEVAFALAACGAMLEATTEHYAVALLRAMRREGRELVDVVRMLELLHVPATPAPLERV